MPRERLVVTGRVPAAPGAVWAVVRDFAAPWHPWIATMAEERLTGGGMVRRFTVRDDPTVYRERLTYLSDTDRVLAYTHLQGIEGVDRYAARLSVAPAEGGGSSVLWSAEVSAGAGRLTAICDGTRAVFEAGIAALAAAPEPPPPEPPPALLRKRASLREAVLDGTPRLALTLTPEAEGPLVLFLHGIGGGRDNWQPQLAALSGRHRAAALDLRGYGGSTLGFGPSTVDLYCEDILRVADHLGADRLVLVGLSYGAWLATSFAMRHGDLLAGLVLSGGCTGMSEAGPEEREAFRVSREVPLDAGRTPADFAPAVVEVIAGPNADADLRAALLASMAAIPAATYRDALNCFTNPLERFDFARLDMPCLLMTGEHDRLAPPAEIRAVAGRILDAASLPDIRFEVLAGAGHVCNLGATEAYNRHLLAFLERVCA
ncbi:MAG: alpha/beta fold hydrolase [Gemmobacter sp.]